MVDSFYSRKKTCRFQGRIKHGLTVCTKDGSVRHAAKCNCYDCPRWNRTPWKAFLWWWDYGTIVYSWKELVVNWKQRWKKDA